VYQWPAAARAVEFDLKPSFLALQNQKKTEKHNLGFVGRFLKFYFFKFV